MQSYIARLFYSDSDLLFQYMQTRTGAPAGVVSLVCCAESIPSIVHRLIGTGVFFHVPSVDEIKKN